MRAIIVDDEVLAIERISHLLKKVKEIEIAGKCSNGKDAVEKINTVKPDILFLDISLKDLDGFEILERIDFSPKPKVVFVTAYDQFALKAFEVEAVDFLLKPFKQERFYKVIEKVLKEIETKNDIDFDSKVRNLITQYTQELVGRKAGFRIPVKQGNRTSFIDTPDIIYIIASGYYAEIFTKEKKFLVRESLTNLITHLDENAFARIHRSAIINISFIQEVIHSNYSEIDVKMKDGKVLRVSKSQKKEFIQKMKM